MVSYSVFSFILFAALCVSVNAHSYVTTPISRGNQRQSNSGCRGPACLGPCEVTVANAETAATTIARGATISVEWPRNNHAGGFVRFAWAQTADSDTMSYFDDDVQKVVCFENGGCGPSDPTMPDGGDNGTADGSYRACSNSVTVPPHLTDGTWTLQWAWFGGAFQLGDYYSCIDYIVSGGASGTAPTPYFQGGDWSNPTNDSVCKYFNTNSLHVCIDEPCLNPPYPGEHDGPVANIAATSTSSDTSATSNNGGSGNGGSGGQTGTGTVSQTGGGNCYVGSLNCVCTHGGGCDLGFTCLSGVCVSELTSSASFFSVSFALLLSMFALL